MSVDFIVTMSISIKLGDKDKKNGFSNVCRIGNIDYQV